MATASDCCEEYYHYYEGSLWWNSKIFESGK